MIFFWTTSAASVSFLAYWHARKMQDWLTLKGCQHVARRSSFAFEADSTSYGHGTLVIKGARLRRSAEDAGTAYSACDVTVERIELHLSLARFVKGLGLVRNCAADGIRGLVDRRHVIHYDAAHSSTDSHPASLPQTTDQPTAMEYATRTSHHRHGKNSFRFNLDQVTVSDLLLTVLSPDNFRPYTVSVLSAKLPRLRSDWFFLDLLSAESIVGMFDRCLFSLHGRQSAHGGIGDSRWRHFKIDGIRVDHVKGEQGLMSWFDRGAIDVDAFISIEADRVRLTADFTLRDLHATAPATASLKNAALIRPVTAYLNDNRPYITVHGESSIPMGMMQEGWSVYDTGIASAMTRAVSADVIRRANSQRVRNVSRIGLWSIYQMLFS